MIEPDKPVAPYLPFRTFLNSLDSLSQGVPPKLDRTLWRGQSGLLQGLIINAYRFFGLANEQDGDTPSDELIKMTNHPEQRPEILRALLEITYMGILQEHDLTKMTMKMLEDAFEKSFSVSGTTKQKAITFFLKAAKYSELPLSPYLQSQIRNVGARRKRSTRNDAVQSNGANANILPSEPEEQTQGTSKTIELKSGGKLTLIVSVNVFDLQASDREFVFGMIDKLQEYEEKKQKASE